MGCVDPALPGIAYVPSLPMAMSSRERKTHSAGAADASWRSLVADGVD